MIVIDASALMAIVLDEAEAGPCITAIEQNRDLAISAGTLAESLIIATRRGIGPAMEQLIADSALETIRSRRRRHCRRCGIRDVGTRHSPGRVEFRVLFRVCVRKGISMSLAVHWRRLCSHGFACRAFVRLLCSRGLGSASDAGGRVILHHSPRSRVQSLWLESLPQKPQQP